jgi:hypothetical protein
MQHRGHRICSIASNAFVLGGHKAAAVAAVQARVDVYVVSSWPAGEMRKIGLFRKYSDHEFSVVDCASFVIARKKNIREVFGLTVIFSGWALLWRRRLPPSKRKSSRGSFGSADKIIGGLKQLLAIL